MRKPPSPRCRPRTPKDSGMDELIELLGELWLEEALRLDDALHFIADEGEYPWEYPNA